MVDSGWRESNHALEPLGPSGIRSGPGLPTPNIPVTGRGQEQAAHGQDTAPVPVVILPPLHRRRHEEEVYSSGRYPRSTVSLASCGRILHVAAPLDGPPILLRAVRCYEHRTSPERRRPVKERLTSRCSRQDLNLLPRPCDQVNNVRRPSRSRRLQKRWSPDLQAVALLQVAPWHLLPRF